MGDLNKILLYNHFILISLFKSIARWRPLSVKDTNCSINKRFLFYLYGLIKGFISILFLFAKMIPIQFRLDWWHLNSLPFTIQPQLTKYNIPLFYIHSPSKTKDIPVLRALAESNIATSHRNVPSFQSVMEPRERSNRFLIVI